MNLKERQHQIQQAILSENTISLFNAEYANLGVYRHAYKERLLEALRQHYPVLCQYLGMQTFNDIGLSFIQKNVSRYRSIRWFGNTFSTFIKSIYSESKPYLHELALLEWTLTRVFDANDEDKFSIQEMATISHDVWHLLRLSFHPAVYRLNFQWNTAEYWQSVTKKGTPIHWEPNSTAKPWLFWRKQLSHYMIELTADQAWMIDEARKGATFSQLCEGLSQWHEESDIAMQAASLLKAWLGAEIVAKVIF